MRISRARALFLLAVSMTLLLASLPLFETPIVQAGSCTADCGNGHECTCSGAQCTAKDGWGCAGGDGLIPDKPPCSCADQNQ